MEWKGKDLLQAEKIRYEKVHRILWGWFAVRTCLDSSGNIG